MRKILGALVVGTMYSIIGFANVCDKIGGSWTGEWENYDHTVFGATLDINQADATHFFGQYMMSNGESNPFRGACTELAPGEAYLNLPNSPPLDNPCRGLLIDTGAKVVIHFHCFNPNNSGYFIKE